MSSNRNRVPALTPLFGEADLESDDLGESSERCSYAPPVSEVGAFRLLDLEDEPLRESREPFRAAVRGTVPQATAASDVPATIEEALARAARSSFASQPPEADRPSGMHFRAPSSIEEAVLRVVESLEPFEPMPRKIPKA